MSDDWRADVARNIADRADVDWDALGGEAPASTDPELVDELRVLERVARVHSETPVGPAEPAAGPSLDVLPGEWGPLTVLEHIGRGTFGDVYRAHDPRLDRTVALKILRRQQPAEASAVIEEARLLARVSHPNVVAVYGAERIGGQVGVWMSFIDGPTLEDELRAKGPFDPLVVLSIGLDLCAALDAVHRAGVVHHDVKTQNVMRAADGRVVLADFGAGSDVSALGSPTAGDLAGTPLYLAPEVLANHPASPQSDIYSFGVVLFHLVTGSFPVVGRTIDDLRHAHAAGERRRVQQTRPDLPARLTRIVDRCLAPNPVDRFPDVASVAQALERASGRVWTGPRSMTTTAVVLTVVVAALAIWRVGQSLVAPPVGSPSSSADVMSTRRIREGGAASVSADGRYLVGGGYVRDLATGAERPWYSESDVGGIGNRVAVSRDGRAIAYEWCTDGPRCELRVTSLSSGLGTWHLLLRDPDRDVRFQPSDWSPDGHLILVEKSRADGPRDIGIVDARNRSLRILTRVDWRGSTALFSPDGRAFAYDASARDTDSGRDIFVMAVDGGEPIPAVVGPAHDELMGWTPDGGALLFASNRSGTTDLWAVPWSRQGAAGNPTRLKTGIGNVRSLGMTRAGALYFTTAANEVDIELVSVDLSSGKRISEPVRPPQSVPGTNLEPAWSADGKQLAYVSRWAGEELAGGTIAIYSALTRELRELPPLRLAWVLGLSWAPDGRSLAFVAADLKGSCGIFRIDVNTGVVSRTAYPIPLTFQTPYWSAAGTRLYFQTIRDGFYEWDTTLGRLRRLRPGPVPWRNLGPISMSPDGRWIASYERPVKELQSVMIRAIDGGESREIFRLSDGELDNIPMPWTPTSDAVMVRKFASPRDGPTRGSELWLIPLDGSAPRKLDVDLSAAVDGQLGKIRLSPDGKQLAYVVGKSYRSETWVLENFLPGANPQQ